MGGAALSVHGHTTPYHTPHLQAVAADVYESRADTLEASKVEIFFL